MALIEQNMLTEQYLTDASLTVSGKGFMLGWNQRTIDRPE